MLTGFVVVIVSGICISLLIAIYLLVVTGMKKSRAAEKADKENIRITAERAAEASMAAKRAIAALQAKDALTAFEDRIAAEKAQRTRKLLPPKSEDYNSMMLNDTGLKAMFDAILNSTNSDTIDISDMNNIPIPVDVMDSEVPHWVTTQEDDPSAICCKDADDLDDPNKAYRACTTCEHISETELDCKSYDEDDCKQVPTGCVWDPDTNTCSKTGASQAVRVPCTKQIIQSYCPKPPLTSSKIDVPNANFCCVLNDSQDQPLWNCLECEKIRNNDCWQYDKDSCTFSGHLNSCTWNTVKNRCETNDIPLLSPSLNCNDDTPRFCSPIYDL